MMAEQIVNIGDKLETKGLIENKSALRIEDSMPVQTTVDLSEGLRGVVIAKDSYDKVVARIIIPLTKYYYLASLFPYEYVIIEKAKDVYEEVEIEY